MSPSEVDGMIVQPKLFSNGAKVTKSDFQIEVLVHSSALKPHAERNKFRIELIPDRCVVTNRYFDFSSTTMFVPRHWNNADVWPNCRKRSGATQPGLIPDAHFHEHRFFRQVRKRLNVVDPNSSSRTKINATDD